MLRLICDMINAGQKPMANHHLHGRMGPILDAKMLGFGTQSIMIKLYGGPGGWVVIDPLTYDIVKQ